MSVIENARMQQKRGTAEFWEANGNFVPKDGEVIVIHDASGENTIAVKVGDGSTPVKNLRAVTGEIYVQQEEPPYAEEGALWIEPNIGSNGKGTLGFAVDWDNKVDDGSYVSNRPIYLEDYMGSWDGDNSSIEKRCMSNLHPQGKEFIGGFINFIETETGEQKNWPIVAYFTSQEEADAYFALHGASECAYVISGVEIENNPNSLNDYILYADTRDLKQYFCFVNHNLDIAPIGIFASQFKQPRQTVRLMWSAIKVDPRYEKFFAEVSRDIRIDTTLTESGMAADAQVVGNALTSLYQQKSQVQIITWEEDD